MTQASNGLGALAIPTAPSGNASMASPVVMQKDTGCDGSTKSSSVISDRTSGTSQPASRTSPKLSVPTHRRNK